MSKKSRRIGGYRSAAKKARGAKRKALLAKANALEGGTRRKKTRRSHGKKRSHAKKKTTRRTKKTAGRRTKKAARRRSAGRRAPGNITVRAVASAGAKAPSRGNPGRRRAHGRKGRSHGKRRAHSHRGYRMSNPHGNWMGIAIFSGAALGGFIVGGIVDRLVATRTPSGGQHPWYGPDAAALIAARPDAMRIGVGLVAPVGLLFLAKYADKKGHSKTSYVTSGFAVGWLIHTGASLYYSFIVPKAFEVTKGDEETISNRIYSDSQPWLYDNADNIRTDLLKRAEPGKDAAGYPEGQKEPLPAVWDTTLQDAIKMVATGQPIPGTQGSLAGPKEQTRQFPDMRTHVETIPVEQRRGAVAEPPKNANGHLAGCGCNTCAAPPFNTGPAGDMYTPGPSIGSPTKDAWREILKRRNQRMAAA
jgi:hypothetical protein